jgi:arylsulfate sulfotransferase
MRFTTSRPGASHTLTHSRFVLSFFMGIFLLALVGCATSSYTPFVTAVSSTANPLVAQYTVQHYHPGFSVWIEFGTDTNYGRQTSVVSDSVSVTGGAAVNILVAGMLPQTTYHMRAHVDSPTGSWLDQDQTFTTGAVPALKPPPQFKVTTGPANVAPAPGIELLSLVAPTGDPNNPNVFSGIATDLQGRIIWYCPQPAEPLKLLPNGHFIYQIGTDLQEVDLACNVVRDISLAQVNQSLQAHGYSFPPLTTFHHDMLVLPNGHWIALAQVTENIDGLTGYSGPTPVMGDLILDIDPTGDVVWVWSAFDHTAEGLDPNRHLQGLPDWTHSNALVYTADGNLLLSIRHQSWIIKVDYENGAGDGHIVWKLGQDGDYTLTNGDPSQWFYAEHYPSVLSVDGSKTTLAVFDNGNLRLDSSLVPCGSTATAPSCYTRATIFQLDEDKRQATIEWQYLPGFFSFWGGSIEALTSGNSRHVEFTSSDPFNTLSAQIREVTDDAGNPEIVWQMDITGAWAYRGNRIPSLYPGVKWQH